MKCPVCGSTSFREAYQCPARNSEPVCAACCQACEYYRHEGLWCRWRLAHPQRDIEEEIRIKHRQAGLMKTKKEALWKRGNTVAASRVEEQWRQIWDEIKRMEEGEREKRA